MPTELKSLGWSDFFEAQLSEDEKQVTYKQNCLYRITAIHRGRMVGKGYHGEVSLIASEEFQPISQFIGVGDWVVAEEAYEHHRIVKKLDAFSKAERLSRNVVQILASNVDFLWIVTSANEEFNLNRLHRYVSMAHKFGIKPVLILNKIDLCDDVEPYLDEIADLNILLVHAISKHKPDSMSQLEQYYQAGHTIALVGSSGVGKTSLLNHISNVNQPTKEIRAFDSKGQHTTTHRELFYCQNDLAVIDTPGLRELQLVESDENQDMEDVFADIRDLAMRCKFNNCSHQNEPGCKVQHAIEEGYLEIEYFENYLKLKNETDMQQNQSDVKADQKVFHKAHFKKRKKQINKKRK